MTASFCVACFRLKTLVDNGIADPGLRYLRVFRKRESEGIFDQYGLLLGQKAGKKRGLQLLIR